MQQIQKRQPTPPTPTPTPPHRRRSRSTSRHNTPTRRRSRSRSNSSRVSLSALMPEHEDSTTKEVVNTYGTISRISGYEPVRELSPSVSHHRSRCGYEEPHPRDRARKIDQWVAQAIQVKTVGAKPSTTKARSDEATIQEATSKTHRAHHRSQSLAEKYPPPPKKDGIKSQSPHFSRKRGKSSSTKRRASTPQKRREDHVVAVRDLSLLAADQESSKGDILTGFEINCGSSNVSSMTTLLSFDTTTSSYGTHEDDFYTSKQHHPSIRRQKEMSKKISGCGADRQRSRFSTKNLCAHESKYSRDNSRQRSARSLSTASLTDTDTETCYSQCTFERKARALVSELKKEVDALDKQDYGHRKDQRPSGILKSRSFLALQDDGVDQTSKIPFKNRSPIQWRRRGGLNQKAERRKSSGSQGTAPTVSTGMSAWLGDLEDEGVINGEFSLNSECF
ncbi:hypothetical protein THAOC_22681 [Thalassiosira oceanica]|uniref:Uncharacterized protein n=1 Tax=Thalassiosira oceanica TaxID=159749 RepID=K0RWC5_THAOC|nr:hypothetical protein THAOC_22681 [Thalassiosira oceanica]|eukprot:EJK57290.1 hypothetical protein THAOC_22681 [Thalassiosira oceanica]